MHLELSQALLLGGAPESVAADFNKPFGQDVLEEATNKVMGAEGHVAQLLGPVIPIAKSDLALVQGFQATVDQGHPEAASPSGSA